MPSLLSFSKQRLREQATRFHADYVALTGEPQIHVDGPPRSRSAPGPGFVLLLIGDALRCIG